MPLTCSPSAVHNCTKEQMDQLLITRSSPAHHLSRPDVNDGVYSGSRSRFQVCLSAAHKSRKKRFRAGRATWLIKFPPGISTKRPQVKEQTGSNTVCIKWKLKLISHIRFSLFVETAVQRLELRRSFVLSGRIILPS